VAVLAADGVEFLGEGDGDGEVDGFFGGHGCGS
jgi:hypothetical protein